MSSQKRKRQEAIQHAPAFWYGLSETFLTKGVLQEFDRNSTYPQRCPRPSLPAADVLRTASRLKEIKRLSRHGGPDNSDLRNYPYPNLYHEQSIDPTNSDLPTGQAASEPDNQNGRTTAYCQNFEQHLIDHNIYPYGYKRTDGSRLEKRRNLTTIAARLTRRRPSLSSTNITDDDFEDFLDADAQAKKDHHVKTRIIPTIEGKNGSSRCVDGGYPFNNLDPLTDGTLAAANPDFFSGARPEQLDQGIRDALNKQIIPSTDTHLPILPNFFLEAKGPSGDGTVAIRQACYDGALGARAIHALRTHNRDGKENEKAEYDHNAYTITATYGKGVLKLYAHHVTKPRDPDGRPEYIMTQLTAIAMTGCKKSFLQGVRAYRNARDWAKEQRDELISSAMER